MSVMKNSNASGTDKAAEEVKDIILFRRCNESAALSETSFFTKENI